MPNFICTTCGTQYAESDQPPGACAVCEDDRQYVKVTGQQWSTHEKLRLANRNSIRFEEPRLTGIGIDPHFAIGQRALFVRTPTGNVLWDCVPLLDLALVEMVKALGGISAIAISHPHYYTTMVEWSRAFGDVPIYLHAADRQWVMRPDKAIAFWDGETKILGEGLTLIRCGGHFEGGTVLHWQGGAGGKGALLTGDIIQVVADRKEVARELGFSDELYFSRLFKKATGYSPTFFREFETEIRGGSNLSMFSSHAPIPHPARTTDN